MNNLTTEISLTFWLRKECLLSIWTSTYPNYRAGDEICLTQPTDQNGQQNLDEEETSQECYIVKKVVHFASKVISDGDLAEFLRIEVYLERKEI